MTFKEFKTWLEREYEAVADIKSDCIKKGYYGSANFWIGYSKAMGEILSTLDSVEQGEVQNKVRNDFSWDNVNIGDKCINGNYIGTVFRLIFDSDGYCCGMVVNFSNESDYKWAIAYQDDEYKNLKQIGGWVNE